MSSLAKLKKELKKLSNPKRAEASRWFFKTGKGEYGEGDIFIGIGGTVQRKISKKYLDLSFKDLQDLLNSKIHEYRQVALLILVYKYSKEKIEEGKKKIYNFYLKNYKNINNWDLVDISAPHVVGAYLLDKKKNILYKLAKSKNLWQKRISIVSTFAFIRNNQLRDTLKISEILLKDEHDLIHKAVGWMLREVGKKDAKVLDNFLKKNLKEMPRTMLRYAIEKFDEKKRKMYMKK